MAAWHEAMRCGTGQQVRKVRTVHDGRVGLGLRWLVRVWAFLLGFCVGRWSIETEAIYRKGCDAGYARAVIEDANKTSWMLESQRTLQAANRKLCEERNQQRLHVGKLVAEANELKAMIRGQDEIIACLHEAASLAVQANGQQAGGSVQP